MHKNVKKIMINANQTHWCWNGNKINKIEKKNLVEKRKSSITCWTYSKIIYNKVMETLILNKIFIKCSNGIMIRIIIIIIAVLMIQ